MRFHYETYRSTLEPNLYIYLRDNHYLTALLIISDVDACINA